MPIHPAEAAGLLSYAAATDNREVTETAAHAWAAALDDKVTPRDGKAAIDAHRSTSVDWLMPAHINAEVRRIRRQRLDGMETPQPPEALDGIPARELAWQREYRRAVGDGSTEADALTAACNAVGIPVPKPLEIATRPPELTVAHRKQCDCGCLERPLSRHELTA